MLMRTNTETIPTLWNNNNVSSPLKISDWIDEVFEDALGWPQSTSRRNFRPELNVYETDKAFEVAVALPGMDKNDFNISYDSGTLTISGERRMDEENKERRYHRIESRFGSFTRSIPLPADVVNDDKIKAKYENGVLSVNIPKVKEKAAKKIPVN